MRCGLIVKKIGMTRHFSNDGLDIPVTILKLENVQVVGLSTLKKNGYNSVHVGAGIVKTKNVNKPLRGYFAKSKVEPKAVVREFRVSEDMLLNLGDTFSSKHFHIGQKIDAKGISIGKGFSGAMKRHNFAGLRASHGVSISHRSHGSTGNSQDPGRVWKGKKMAGQYGNVKKTIQNLTIIDIDENEDLIFVKGSVPGAKNSFLILNDALKSNLPNGTLRPAGLKSTITKNVNKNNLAVDDNKSSVKKIEEAVTQESKNLSDNDDVAMDSAKTKKEN